MAGVIARTPPEPVYQRPWVVLGVGVGLLLIAALTALSLSIEEGHRSLAGLRIVFLLSGTVIAYAGVVQRLQRATWDFPARVESAAMVSVAGVGLFAAYYAADPAWSSVRLFFVAIFLLSLVGALLILLPGLARRIALSLIILFHLAGIVTAVSVVDPPNSTAPWISRQLMARVYRPYLSFLYMLNAYHFYAPEPGAPSLLRIAVYYSDGKYAWHQISSKSDSPIGMDYQRLNALPEQCFQAFPRLPWSESELREIAKRRSPPPPPPRGSWENIKSRRVLGSMREYRPDGKPIPMVGDLTDNVQYQEPTDNSRKQVASVARHIFHWPAVQRPGLEITSIKVYRVTPNPVTPAELSMGARPGDRTKWASYFLGEFNDEGEILHPFDPFLYWYLPILKVPSNFPHRGATWHNGIPYVRVNIAGPKDGILYDCLEMHAATPSPEEK